MTITPEVEIHVFPDRGMVEWVAYADYAALAAQLEARDRSLKAALESVARARDDALVEAYEAAKKAEIGFHDGIGGDWHMKDGAAVICSVRAEIEALRTQPTTSVEPMTVQEAGKLVLDTLMGVEEHDAWYAAQDVYDAGVRDGAMGEASDVVIAALRAVAGGRNE